MSPQPTLTTRRLVLRPFTVDDAERVRLLAGDRRIADVTASIPHPYPEGVAEDWISTHAGLWNKGEAAVFAVTLTEGGRLIGSISLMNIKDGQGELGYWLGVNYWNNGYCSEACRAVVQFGLTQLKLARIHAHHLSRNPASGKVLLSAGLIHTGSGSATCGYRRQNEPVEFYERVCMQP